MPHEQDEVPMEPVSQVDKCSEGTTGLWAGDCYSDTVVSDGLPEVTLQRRPASEKSQICADVVALPCRQRSSRCKGPGVVCAWYIEQWRPVWLEQNERE